MSHNIDYEDLMFECVRDQTKRCKGIQEVASCRATKEKRQKDDHP